MGPDVAPLMGIGQLVGHCCALHLAAAYASDSAGVGLVRTWGCLA
jgi:hypothetical protein